MASPDLHWTFDYPQAADGLDYREELLGYLREARACNVASPTVCEYAVLPNYWAGYRPGDPAPEKRLAFGRVRISRKSAGEVMRYTVGYRHEASGEDLRLAFETASSDCRELRGEWTVHATNDSAGEYDDFACSGGFTAGAIELRVGDLAVGAGGVATGEPIICNWALFDALVPLYERGGPFAVLEDLEKLKPCCRVVQFDTWNSPCGELQGYALYGQGHVPSYWWVDANCNTVIMTNTFNTFVLRRMGHGGAESAERTGEKGAREDVRPPVHVSGIAGAARPNILFINTDQHSWDAISAYGNPYVRTPTIDRLHRHGVSFTRSYCSDPVCAPARSSWMTGLYTSENGVPFNGGHLHEDIPDLGQILNGNGYNAFHCGKWHVDGCAPDRGFRVLYHGRRPIGAGGAEFYDPASTHAALRFLSTYDEPEPFYLQIGLINPHDICEYGHNFERKDIPHPSDLGIVPEAELPPMPDNAEYDPRETILHIVSRRTDDPLIHKPILHAVRKWDDMRWRVFLWHYYRFIEKVDQEVGLILSALAQSRFRDNTLIVFSTDHGEAGGRHRMFQKFTLYEESIHVPFIVASLGDRFGIPKGTFDREHFVSGVDFLPTVCDYAGVSVPFHVSGHSLRPLIEGQEGEWRDCAYVESNYWGRAIVTDRFKYVTEYVPRGNGAFMPPCSTSDERGREQLFDLETDPGETVNLAGRPELNDVLADLRQRLSCAEADLDRRRITKPGPAARISHWGARVRQYRENAEGHLS